MSKTKVQYVGLVIDRSGSMDFLRTEVVQFTNKILDKLLEESKINKIKTFLTLCYFNHDLYFKYENVNINDVERLNTRDYIPYSDTALFDAVIATTTKISQFMSYNNKKDLSSLIITVTDGQENSSKNNDLVFNRLIRDYQSTDKWTFTFQLPEGFKNVFCNKFNVPQGNCIEWDISKDGLEKSSSITSDSLSRFYGSRLAGISSSDKFYIQTDLSDLNTKDLKNNLIDLRNEYKIYTIDKEYSIKDFVELKTHRHYVPGTAFYLLMKKEKIQPNKQILIMEKGKPQVWGGYEARNLIGLPHNKLAVVEPYNHANKDIFVQSNSVNRKLVRGTKILVKI